MVALLIRWIKGAILLTCATQCVHFFHHCPAGFYFFVRPFDHTLHCAFLDSLQNPSLRRLRLAFVWHGGLYSSIYWSSKCFLMAEFCYTSSNVVNSLRALLSAGSQLFQCAPPGRSSVVCGSLQVPSWGACLRKRLWGLCGRAGSWLLIFVQGTPSAFPVWQGPGNLGKIKTAEAEGKKKKNPPKTQTGTKIGRSAKTKQTSKQQQQTTQNRRDSRWQKSRIGLDLENRE